MVELSPGSSSNSNSAGPSEGNNNNNNNECGPNPVPERRLGGESARSSSSPATTHPNTSGNSSRTDPSVMLSGTEEKQPFSSRNKGRATSDANRAQRSYNNLHTNANFERNQTQTDSGLCLSEKSTPTGRKDEVSGSSSASPSSVMSVTVSPGRVEKPFAGGPLREEDGTMASKEKKGTECLVELEDDEEDDALSPPPLKYASSNSGRVRFAAPKTQLLEEDSDEEEAMPPPPSLRASSSLSSLPLRSSKLDLEARPNEDEEFIPPPPALVSSCSSSRPSWYAAQTSTDRGGDQSIESKPPRQSPLAARRGRENGAVTLPPLHPSSAVSSQGSPKSPRQDLGIANTLPSSPKHTSKTKIADTAQHDPIDVDAYMSDDDSKDDEEKCLSKLPGIAPVSPPPPNLSRRSSDRSPSSQHSKNRASVSESQRLPFVNRSRSSSTNYSVASSNDEKVPPETLNVSRTPSQEAAIAAVLGDDDQDLALKKDCVATEELLDEELGAAIRPELRRHCDSTPGAFRAGGIGSRLETTPPPSARRTQSAAATLTRNVSFESSILQETSPSCVDDYCVTDSCTTLVSATLVTAADSCTEVETTTTNNDNSNNANRRNKPDPPPVLALAEPMWRKRRVVLCLSLWALAAVGVVAMCVTLALVATGAFGGGDGNSENQKEDLSQPSGGVSVVPTLSPTTETTSTVKDPTERIVSSHAVSWGKISTCDDANFFSQSDNNLLLRCGGVLELVRAFENVECVTVPFQGFDDIPDESRLSCKLKVPEPELTDSGEFFQEALGMVIFNCIGVSDAERTATVALPTMTIENCTVASSDNSNRRRLSEAHQLSQTVSALPIPAQKARDRALEQVQVKGGAANYVSLGRFCQEPSGEWLLWHEWYTCEEGSRVLITPVGEVYDEGNALLGSESSGGSGGGGGGFFSDLLGQFMNNGGNRRHLDDASATAVDGRGHRRKLQFDELIAPLYKLFDLDNFCYAIRNTDACAADAGGSVCSVTLAPVRMSDADSRSTCKSRENDGPPVESMRSIADEEFHPQKFLDLMGKDL